MNILVCGGAGYIGSACTRVLLEAGHHVSVYDALLTGHRSAVPREAAADGLADLLQLVGDPLRPADLASRADPHRVGSHALAPAHEIAHGRHDRQSQCHEGRRTRWNHAVKQPLAPVQ